MILVISYLSAIPALAFLSAVSFILFAGIIFGVYYLNSQLRKEYEYIFTNGELDIDCVINRNKRKRMFSQDLRSAELVVNANNKDHTHDFDGCAVLDYSSGKLLPNTFYVLTVYKGKKSKIIIEPNEMMLNSFATVLTPRKLIKS